MSVEKLKMWRSFERIFLTFAQASLGLGAIIGGPLGGWSVYNVSTHHTLASTLMLLVASLGTVMLGVGALALARETYKEGK